MYYWAPQCKYVSKVVGCQTRQDFVDFLDEDYFSIFIYNFVEQ